MQKSIRNIIISTIMVALGLVLFAIPAMADDIVMPVGERNIYIDGKQYLMDIPSLVKNGRLYISPRSLSKYWQTDVKWVNNLEYESITLTKNGHSLVFLVNENNYLVKHQQFYSCLEEMDACPLLIDGHSYIPMRVLLENFGYQVNYDAGQNSVMATFKGQFYKEGFAIPLNAAIPSIKAYPADVLLEFVIINNPELDQQLIDLKSILDSKSIDPLPIIKEVNEYFQKGDESFSGLGNKISLQIQSPDSILIKIWR